MADPQVKTFLFLQGPHGPYFAMLADALRACRNSESVSMVRLAEATPANSPLRVIG